MYEQQLYLVMKRRRNLTVECQKMLREQERVNIKNLISMQDLRGELKFMNLDRKFIYGEADQLDFDYEQKESKEYFQMMEQRKRERKLIDPRIFQPIDHRKINCILPPKSQPSLLMQKSLQETGVMEFILQKDREDTQGSPNKIQEKVNKVSIMEKVKKQLLQKKRKKTTTIERVNRLLVTQISTISVSERDSGFSRQLSFI